MYSIEGGLDWIAVYRNAISDKTQIDLSDCFPTIIHHSMTIVKVFPQSKTTKYRRENFPSIDTNMKMIRIGKSKKVLLASFYLFRYLFFKFPQTQEL